MRVQRLPLLTHSLLLGTLCSTARAFSFSTTDPTECGDFSLTWTGGQPPFGLTIIPEFRPQIKQTISDDSFQNDKGSFTMQLPLASGQKFVVIMSDQTGPVAGGISGLLQVGASTGASCNTKPGSTNFSFQLPLALKQCENYQFSQFVETGAVPPVQVIAAVPGGTAEILTIPKGHNTLNWIANIAAGTSVLFSMTDSTGGIGGASDLLPVGDSDTNTCLGSSSPSSTAKPGPSSTPPTGSTTTTTGSSATNGSRSISGRALAGIIAGSLVLCTAVIGGAIFFVWRHRQHSSSMKVEMIDLADDPAAATSLLHHPMYTPEPFTSAPRPANLPITPPPPPPPPPPLPAESERDRPEYESTSGSSGSGAAGPLSAKRVPKPSRQMTYVQHTDVYDSPVDEDGVVELPPQYSESRAPISGIPNLADTSGARPSGSSQHPPSPERS